MDTRTPTASCARRRSLEPSGPWLQNRWPARLILIGSLACMGSSIPCARAQVSPTLMIDEDCSTFAYAPDGRIGYAVRHVYTTKHLEIQRDDIWVVGRDGKRKRIVHGEKLVRGSSAFSYAIHSLRWSPDGSRLTAELLTSQMINERGETREGILTLLLDESGKEIRIAGADSVIPEAVNATWLADSVTVVYLQEAVKPRLLYSIHSVRPVAGRGGPLFPEHGFTAVAWDAKRSSGVAIERDRSLTGPPRLVALDLLKETVKELTTLEGYAGELTLSPSGGKVAYFRDPGVLEVRELRSPERVTRARVALGAYEWARNENRILLKRGPQRRSGDLAWVALPTDSSGGSASGGASTIPEPAHQPVLHGLNFRDFEISPDGHSLAVTQPGKRALLVYPLP